MGVTIGETQGDSVLMRNVSLSRDIARDFGVYVSLDANPPVYAAASALGEVAILELVMLIECFAGYNYRTRSTPIIQIKFNALPKKERERGAIKVTGRG